MLGERFQAINSISTSSKFLCVLVKGAAPIGASSRVVAKVCLGLDTDVHKDSRCVTVGVDVWVTTETPNQHVCAGKPLSNIICVDQSSCSFDLTVD